MMRVKLIFLAIAVVICVGIAGAARTSQSPELREAVGKWRGSGKIIVLWCDRDSLSVDLTIDSDGDVRGTIGDATVAEAEFGRRSWIMRKLGNGNYLIRAKLDGYLIEAEGIRREAIWFMFDIADGHLVGSINSTGAKFGGKERMPMTVMGVDCRRVAQEATVLR